MKRRYPNPWIAIPSIVAGGLAAWLGGTITAVSCRVRDEAGRVITCPGLTALVAILAFIAVMIGMAIVLVLVYRSLAEWQEQRSPDR
ncbi:MAG: hypothetical protein WB239_16690 [Acidimicrobiia bacterium]